MGARDTLLVIESAAGTDLFEWAAALGLEPRRTLPDPGLIPSGTDLLVVDLTSGATGFDAHPRLEPWRRGADTGQRVLVTATPRRAGCRDGQPYGLFLSPRECLRQLALGPEALAGYYAQHPHDYLTDCGEHPQDFEDRLRAPLGAAAARTLPTLWREAIGVLRQPGWVRDLGDLTLVLVPASVNPTLALAAARCLVRTRHDWSAAGQGLPAHPLLMLVLAGEAAPWESPGADPRAAVRGLHLFAQEAAPGQGRAGWRTVNPPPDYAYAWDYNLVPLEGDPGAHLRALDQDLSALLTGLLVDQRPLRHYGCTFFFPFDPGDRAQGAFAAALQRQLDTQGEAPGRVAIRPRHYQGDLADACDTQALLYFLPHLRDLLYDLNQGGAELDPIREWSLTGTAGWRLELDGDPPGSPLKAAEVESVRLLRYFNGSYLLALRVVLPAPTGDLAALGCAGPTWWHPLVFADAQVLARVRGRALAAWLGFTRLARVVYPSFPEQFEEGKIAAELRLVPDDGSEPAGFRPIQAQGRLLMTSPPGLLLSPVLRYLLTRFFGNGPLAGAPSLAEFLNGYQDFYDDRLFVNVAYGLAGPAPEPALRTAVMGRLFSLALLVDRPVDTFDDCGGYAYDRDWLAETLDLASLKVWDATGLYAGFTDMSNAWLGAGGYFCETVAARHVPYSYERMLILCLFYLASLRRYHRQVSVATAGLIRQGSRASDRTGAFKALREEFITFTNRYWFREVTPQLQGRRVFALQQRALGLEAEYQLIKDELERAHEFLEAEHDHELREFSAKLSTLGQRVGVAALLITLTALWAAILPLIPLDGGTGPLGAALSAGQTWLREGAILLLAIVPPGLLSWVLWRRFFSGRPAGTDAGPQGQGADAPRKRR